MKCRYLATGGFRHPAKHEPESKGEYAERKGKHFSSSPVNNKQKYPFGTQWVTPREKPFKPVFI